MSHPAFPQASRSPFGSSLLDKSKANPASVDMSIFEKKSPVGQGAVSSDYLQKTRQDNPEPDSSSATDSVSLSNCRITTDPSKLAAEQPFEVAADIKGPADAVAGDVTFNLFCCVTKADGTEEVQDLSSPAQAPSKAGSATAQGTLAAPNTPVDPGAKVKYFAVAQHSKAGEKAESPKVEAEAGKVPQPLAVWSLGAVHFGFDSSFLVPTAAEKIEELKGILAQHPGAAIAIFGHADPVGDDAYNSGLSGRRAFSVFCALTKNVDGWLELSRGSSGDKWDLRATQTILSHLKNAAGQPYHTHAIDGTPGRNTDAAIKAFQADHGLASNGIMGPATAAKLYEAYLGSIGSIDLKPEDFLGDPSDKKRQWACNACGESNPVLVFSQADDDRFRASSDKRERNAKNAPNRRAVVMLFPPSAKGPGKVTFPCGSWSDGPSKCTAQFFDDASVRRNPSTTERSWSANKDTFACRFYAGIAAEEGGAGAGAEEPPVESASTGEISNIRVDKRELWVGDKITVSADTTLDDGAEVAISFSANGSQLSRKMVTVSDKKIGMSWMACDCGLKVPAGSIYPDKVETSVSIEWNGSTFSANQRFILKPIVSSPETTFSKTITFSAEFSVEAEFKQRIENHTVKVDIHKKVIKAYGGYWVNLARHFGGADNNVYYAKSETLDTDHPSHYWDPSVKRWFRIPSDFIPNDDEYSSIGFREDHGVFRECGGQTGVWPESFPLYKYDSHEADRAAWIRKVDKMWSKRFTIARKTCCDEGHQGINGYPVEVDFKMTRVHKDEPGAIALCPGKQRSNTGCWFYGDEDLAMAAHEVGHFVGMPDEYGDKSIDSTQPDGDGLVNGTDYNSVMGGFKDPVKKRHYRNFVSQTALLVKNASSIEAEFVAF